MSSIIPFTLLTAFTSSAYGGNPVAVVFLDRSLPTDTLAGIARNFNQPMTTFLFPTPLVSKSDTVAAFGVRWFTPNLETPLCGHATLAAAKAVFERPNLVPGVVDTIELHTVKGEVVSARKVEEGFIEIQLPAATVEEVSLDQKTRYSEILAKAFGRQVVVNYVGKGGRGFEYYLLVELDEKENLEACQINADPLRDTGFTINVITTASTTGNELFVSRMFAPGIVPGDEDHVCGSAHCLMAPYWYKKRGIPGGQETKAKQVSPRGGDLKVIWEADMNIVRLIGEVVVLGKGELCHYS
ncbi:Diaminopimelate epimerase-like protein [Tricholoma matsutake]|nr:Diaminopimelate epimerase-like protein [Tricholoma matsutake 945]